MAGINVYDRVVGRYGSITEARQKQFRPPGRGAKPCIFLSHIRHDKEMVKTFGDYIKSVGVDIYLDAEDEELKAAVDAEDHRRITEYIEVGIRNSTDVLVFLSDRTKETWWVPYEIGFGKADGKDLRCVKLKKVDCSRLSFLTIVDVLQTRRQFARYVDEVRKRQEENEPLLEREGRVGVVTKLLDLLREIEYDSPTGGGRLAEYLDE